MKINYTIVCLLICLSEMNAQNKSAELKKNISAPSKVSAVQLTADQINKFLETGNPATNPNLTTINTLLAVGQIPISSLVNANGAKCYNVPIDIAPGRQGLQPGISLSYNSQADNGLVGIGWNLSGLSTIQRTNKSIFFDGILKSYAFKADDAFTLDGNRLMKTSTGTNLINYESSNGNIKAIAYLSGDVVRYFKVYYPNGSVGTFGTEINTQSCLSYPVTQCTDVNGNSMKFIYQLDDTRMNPETPNEFYYINRIEYGQNSSLPSFASVQFVYESRTDELFSMHSGRSVVIRKRLKKIESYVNANKIRSYELTYSNADPRKVELNKDVSRLLQINCSSGSEQLNPLKFFYGNSGEYTLTTQTITNQSFLSSGNYIRARLGKQKTDDAIVSFTPPGVLTIYDMVKYHDRPLSQWPSGDIQGSLSIHKNLSSPNATVSTFSSTNCMSVLAADFYQSSEDEILKISATVSDYDRKEYINFDMGTSSITRNTITVPAARSLQYTRPKKINGVTPKTFLAGNFTGKGKTEVLMIPYRLIGRQNEDDYSIATHDSMYVVSFANGFHYDYVPFEGGR